MKQVDSTLTEKLTDTLGEHDAFDVRRNPVLVRAGQGGQAASVASVLGQYSLLPATIVEYLKIGQARLARWDDVGEELGRNVGEELGSRTEGRTHYDILVTAAGRELGLSLTGVKPTAATAQFLDDIRRGLHEQPPPHAAGMLFALEASAIPELTVVAGVVNEYAALTGSAESPIILSEAAWAAGGLEGREAAGRYTLNAFFAAHLFDFEVGHRNRLAGALGKHLVSPRERVEFAEGFGSVLCLMDCWWAALADELLVRAGRPLTPAAGRRVIAPLSEEVCLLQL